MLDRTNYTTRTDLSPEELMLLIRVRTGLETGEIDTKHFVMDTLWCGTYGCIGGWMDHYARQNAKGNGDQSGSRHYWTILNLSKFRPLFYPTAWKMHVATPADGIQAINNFLAGRSRPWGFMKKDRCHA
jgi:hypothetical protein